MGEHETLGVNGTSPPPRVHAAETLPVLPSPRQGPSARTRLVQSEESGSTHIIFAYLALQSRAIAVAWPRLFNVEGASIRVKTTSEESNDFMMC